MTQQVELECKFIPAVPVLEVNGTCILILFDYTERYLKVCFERFIIIILFLKCFDFFSFKRNKIKNCISLITLSTFF